jgi:hypothetical protein
MASATATARRSSRRGKDGESAVSAATRVPSTRCATAVRTAESTPPENATSMPGDAESTSSSAASAAAPSRIGLTAGAGTGNMSSL